MLFSYSFFFLFSEFLLLFFLDTLMLKKSIVDVKLLKCPMASVGTDGCSARVPHDVVDEVASIRAKKLYNILIVKDFVNDHNTVLKWCPGRSCECVVERMRRTVQKTTDNKNNESIETRTAVVNFNAVNCDVLHFFCFVGLICSLTPTQLLLNTY